MKMKILFLTVGGENVASSRTRVFQYFPYFKNRGVTWTVLIYLKYGKAGKKISVLSLQRLYGFFVLLCILVLSLGHDIVFIQKVLLPGKFVRVLKFLRRKIVFDFDDAIYSVPPSLENNVDLKVRQGLDKRFRSVVSSSELIIVENTFTGHYAEKLNRNILVITGPIDTVRYSPPECRKADRNIVIGWIGSPDTAVYLKPLFPVFRKLSMANPSVCFKFIGAPPLDLPGVRVRQVPWSLETEVNELHDFDIGIMPLPDDEWSRGKGGYKILQYMAVGIPSVASPVGINAEMIEEKVNGLLAMDETEWYEKLLMLVSNGDLRWTMGDSARKIAEKKYSFFVAVEKLLDALESLRVKT